MQERFRIAIQRSGRLSKESLEFLTRCGVKMHIHEQSLIARSTSLALDVLRVRDDDMPGLVSDGVVDLGIVGENALEERALEHEAQKEGVEFKLLKKLDFDYCRLSLILPQNKEFKDIKDFEGPRIATSYPQLLKRFVQE